MHAELMAWLFGVSLLLFVAGLVGVPLIVVRIRSDYFLDPRPPPGSWRGRHPLASLGWLLLRNLVGGVLIVAGIAMLLLPGQGLLTIVVGLTMSTFPGKSRLMHRLLAVSTVRHAIDWLRVKAGRPPMQWPTTGGK